MARVTDTIHLSDGVNVVRKPYPNPSNQPYRKLMDLDSIYQHLQGRTVVLDLASPYVYIGTLARWDAYYLHLEDADVHDLRDTKTTREIYLVETKRLGINSNRKLVMVRIDDVVSISALDDVIC